MPQKPKAKLRSHKWLASHPEENRAKAMRSYYYRQLVEVDRQIQEGIDVRKAHERRFVLLEKLDKLAINVVKENTATKGVVKGVVKKDTPVVKENEAVVKETDSDAPAL